MLKESRSVSRVGSTKGYPIPIWHYSLVCLDIIVSMSQQWYARSTWMSYHIWSGKLLVNVLHLHSSFLIFWSPKTLNTRPFTQWWQGLSCRTLGLPIRGNYSLTHIQKLMKQPSGAIQGWVRKESGRAGNQTADFVISSSSWHHTCPFTDPQSSALWKMCHIGLQTKSCVPNCIPFPCILKFAHSYCVRYGSIRFEVTVVWLHTHCMQQYDFVGAATLRPTC